MRTFVKVTLAVALLAGLGTLPGLAQKKKTVWDGVYSTEQATRGVATFKANCAACHGESMTGGGGAPAAAGPEFVFNWKGKSVADVFDYMKTNMPPGLAGSISDQRYADLLAAMLQTSEFPAGKTEIPADPKALADVQITAEKP